MDTPLLQLDPALVWGYFHQLNRIPRPSHHEERVQAFVLAEAEALELASQQDDLGNILICKPASAGAEQAPGVILQGHLDMVPQANLGSRHDFATDPIETFIEGEWVKARGTTLGADNGLGVAAILAVLASKEARHGPLEALFTSNEEDGMSGAFGIAPGSLQGRIMINTDSEDEGVLCIGCAGGANVTSRLDLDWERVVGESAGVALSIGGLRGGHSGVDIHRGLGNANKLLFRLLQVAQQRCGFRLSEVQGGNMRNAIPREATAKGCVPAGQLTRLQQLVTEIEAQWQAEFGLVETKLRLVIEDIDTPSSWLTAASQQRLVDLVNGLPSGVVRMSDAMPGLVETSTNLSIVRAGQGEAEICSLVRSSLDSARDAVCDQLVAVARLAAGESRVDGIYPGWKPLPCSETVALVADLYRQLFDRPLEIGAIHAGLECGIIGATHPGLEMLSLGPTIRYPHSPDEALHIPSVERFWRLLLAVLKRLSVLEN